MSAGYPVNVAFVDCELAVAGCAVKRIKLLADPAPVLYARGNVPFRKAKPVVKPVTVTMLPGENGMSAGSVAVPVV